MSASYDSEKLTKLSARLDALRDKLQTLLKVWPTNDDTQLKELQSQQTAMLTFIAAMQKAHDTAEQKTDAMSALKTATDAHKSWQEAAPQRKNWMWLFKKEFDNLETAHEQLNAMLIGLISVQVEKILESSASVSDKANRLKTEVIDKAPDGELAKHAAAAVLKFAEAKANTLAQAKNSGGLGSLWQTIVEATEEAGEGWRSVHETAIGEYEKSGEISQRKVAALVGGIVVVMMVVLALLLIFAWQPTEAFCLYESESVPCKPKMTQTSLAATATAAIGEGAAAQTRAAEEIHISSESAKTTRQYEVAMRQTADVAETVAAATANANATQTQTAVYAAQTRTAEEGADSVATQQAAINATAAAEAAAQQCVQANGYAFEIVEGPVLTPRENEIYVWTEGTDRPLATATWTIRNTGSCSWGLEGFTAGLLDGDGLDTWGGGTMALLKNGRTVGGEVQVGNGEEANLVVYFRGPGTLKKEFILIFGTVGGDVPLISQPHFKLDATNWTILQTPTPTPTTPPPTNTPIPPPPDTSAPQPTVSGP